MYRIISPRGYWRKDLFVQNAIDFRFIFSILFHLFTFLLTNNLCVKLFSRIVVYAQFWRLFSTYTPRVIGR